MPRHTDCALCDTHNVSVVADTDRDGNPLQMVICDSCGLVWVDPRPSDADISTFYSDDYRSAYKGDVEPKLKHCYRETKRAIQRLQRLSECYQANDNILDIGAGAGFFAYVAKRNNIIIDGIEPNKGYAGFARNKLGLEAVQIGYLKDCLNFNHYNIITINHVFEHLPEPLAALQHMHKLLVEDGKIILEVPNIMATYHAPHKVFHIGHLYWYSTRTLAAILARAGFRVVDQILTKDTQHINIIAEKTGSTEFSSPGASHAVEIKSFLANRRPHRHYISPVPYRRFLKKAYGYIDEQRYIRDYSSKIELIES
ncbi:MAG: class I SAM-dependent methyltransferase, partial [Gammaproteobacteria bacterium]